MGRSEVSTSVVEWTEGLSNRVSIIIKDIYIYRLNEVPYLFYCFVYHIFFTYLWFYFVSMYIWLYVLYAYV